MVTASLPPTFRQLFGNPLCVLRHVDPDLLPNSWPDVRRDAEVSLKLMLSFFSQVSMEFSGNRALYGSSILVNGLETCSYPNRDLESVFHWDFITFGCVEYLVLCARVTSYPQDEAEGDIQKAIPCCMH